jgi:hypothetical protein
MIHKKNMWNDPQEQYMAHLTKIIYGTHHFLPWTHHSPSIFLPLQMFLFLTVSLIKDEIVQLLRVTVVQPSPEYSRVLV